MTTTDLAQMIATLEENQRDNRDEGRVSSDEVEALLRSATARLEATAVNRTRSNGTKADYDEIRQSLERVRRIAQDLQEGRY
jgi:hypothetical protein